MCSASFPWDVPRDCRIRDYVHEIISICLNQQCWDTATVGIYLNINHYSTGKRTIVTLRCRIVDIHSFDLAAMGGPAAAMGGPAAAVTHFVLDQSLLPATDTRLMQYLRVYGVPTFIKERS